MEWVNPTPARKLSGELPSTRERIFLEAIRVHRPGVVLSAALQRYRAIPNTENTVEGDIPAILNGFIEENVLEEDEPETAYSCRCGRRVNQGYNVCVCDRVKPGATSMRG